MTLPQSGDGGPPVPTASYRLQLTPDFGFARAAEIVPYLRAMGVSHLYLSPMWEAVRGSTHGYDVIDHGKVREELGGLAGFLSLAATVREAGLGIIVDVVPNHVSVADAQHEWWRDVLRFGQRSEYAPYFDIDWSGRGETAPGVLVIPVLGEPFGVVFEKGDLKLDWDGREFVIRYGPGSYPCRPDSYPEILGIPPADLISPDDQAVHEAVKGVESLSTADPVAATSVLTSLCELASRAESVGGWIGHRVEALNVASPEARSGLDRLISQQHYRLASWRVAPEQINYRRFFDVNTLAGLRMEYEPAFEATHALVIRLCDEGLVQGIRVDHVDGLSDPDAYLKALRGRVGAVPIWVEKILAADEDLPAWPVEGTTGYDFLGHAGRLFVAADARETFRALYRQYGDTPVSPEELSYESRYSIADRAFDGDIAGLTHELLALAQSTLRHRDLTRRSLREALTTILASMPQYRSYLPKGGSDAIERAAASARKRNPEVANEAVEFIAGVLLSEHDPVSDARAAALVQRFQQLSSAVMAKGVEDTAFFRDSRLLCLNEVGSDYARFSIEPSELHRWMKAREETWPRTMNATSTHDTKRSEDARMRLAALTEFAAEWSEEVRTWMALNSALIQRTDDSWFPGSSSEYYLYQSLVATWQADGDDEGYTGRIVDHMLKASREAKRWTSWVRPNEELEASLVQFVREILDPGRDNPFRSRVDAFVRAIEPCARQNSRSLATLKLLAPGMPDVYQGTETWDYSLTDPDNRRPVDFAEVSKSLATPSGPTSVEKQQLVRDLLSLRRSLPEVFTEGGYRERTVTGALARHCFAFERTSGAHRVIAAVPYQVRSLLSPAGTVRPELVAQSVIAAEPACWRDAFNPDLRTENPLDGIATHGVAVYWT